jgi:hypothetical protein
VRLAAGYDFLIPEFTGRPLVKRSGGRQQEDLRRPAADWHDPKSVGRILWICPPLSVHLPVAGRSVPLGAVPQGLAAIGKVLSHAGGRLAGAHKHRR